MIRGICDKPERLAARLYDALWVECGCCLFYRGFGTGIVTGIVVSTIAFVVVMLTKG